MGCGRQVLVSRLAETKLPRVDVGPKGQHATQPRTAPIELSYSYHPQPLHSMLSFRGGSSQRNSKSGTISLPPRPSAAAAARVDSSANSTELFTEEKAEVPENRNSLGLELGESGNSLGLEFGSPDAAPPDLVGHETDGWSNVVVATPAGGGSSSTAPAEEPAFFGLFGMGGPSSADVDPDLGLDLTSHHEFRPERRASFITGMGARFNALFAPPGADEYLKDNELYRPATRDADTQTFWEAEPEPAPPRRRSIFQQIGDVRITAAVLDPCRHTH